jgi:peptide/nickel transport system ATP-binding protein
MVMNQGKVEEISFAEDLYQRPQTEYTKKLLSAIPKGDLEDIRKAQMRRRMQRQEYEKMRKKAAEEQAGLTE